MRHKKDIKHKISSVSSEKEATAILQYGLLLKALVKTGVASDIIVLVYSRIDGVFSKKLDSTPTLRCARARNASKTELRPLILDIADRVQLRYWYHGTFLGITAHSARVKTRASPPR